MKIARATRLCAGESTMNACHDNMINISKQIPYRAEFRFETYGGSVAN